MKKCSRCGKEKPYSEFNKRKHSSDGLRSECRECQSFYSKKSYAHNVEKIHKKHKEAYYKDVEKTRESHRKRAKKSYYKDIESSRKKVRERSKKTYYSNIEKSRNSKRVSNIKKRNKTRISDGNFSVQDIEHILNAQKQKCLMCGNKFDEHNKPTVDHIVPISKKGRNDITNLQLLCKSCNSSKGTKTVDLRSKSVIKKIFEQFRLFEQ